MGALAIQCSALIPFDGYVGPDGSVDAAAADATGDHATPDAASAEASDAVDAGSVDGDAGRWCASLVPAPMFCDDFDDEGDFLPKWSNVILRNGGTVTRDPSAFRSAPSSMLASTPSSTMDSSGYLVFSPSTTVQHVKLAYDMRIDTRDTQAGYAEIAYVVLTGAYRTDFYIRAYQDPMKNGFTTESLSDGSVPQHVLDLGSTMTFDTWRRVAIDIDVATAHAVTVSIDGIQILNQPLEPELYFPGALEVRPGIGYIDTPSGPWSMRWDNVTIDWN
jgi:hypothetical protein